MDDENRIDGRAQGKFCLTCAVEFPILVQHPIAQFNLPGMGGVFNAVSLAMYSYAGQNPVKYVDPDGNASASGPLTITVYNGGNINVAVTSNTNFDTKKGFSSSSQSISFSVGQTKMEPVHVSGGDFQSTGSGQYPLMTPEAAASQAKANAKELGIYGAKSLGIAVTNFGVGKLNALGANLSELGPATKPTSWTTPNMSNVPHTENRVTSSWNLNVEAKHDSASGNNQLNANLSVAF